jgi:membrane glycosyltransferase
VYSFGYRPKSKGSGFDSQRRRRFSTLDCVIACEGVNLTTSHLQFQRLDGTGAVPPRPHTSFKAQCLFNSVQFICAVRCVINIFFPLLSSNYATYVFNTLCSFSGVLFRVFCVFVLFCVLLLVLYIALSFLFLRKSNDRC